MTQTPTEVHPNRARTLAAEGCEHQFRRVLLASEGRPFSAEVLRCTALLLAGQGARAHVISIARVYGSSFGLPNPGLLPTKREFEQQEKQVSDAVIWLRRRGMTASGQVVGTRKGAQRICQEATTMGSEVIIMGADADRCWLTAEMMWSQEPQRVRRRARIPVHLVVEAKPPSWSGARP